MHFLLFVSGAKLKVFIWSTLYWQKKKLFLFVGAKYFAHCSFSLNSQYLRLFFPPHCNWLRNCASDKFGHFFWHQMHHLSNTAQLWEKRHYGTKKKLLFFVHNVEFWEFISYSDLVESLKNQTNPLKVKFKPSKVVYEIDFM